MILYATKRTIEDLNISMIKELSQFNKIMTQKVIEEQINIYEKSYKIKGA